MSGKRTHDWEGLLREWIYAKKQNAKLNHTEFFDSKGISRKTGNRAMGRKMESEWAKVCELARAEVRKKTAVDLSQELLDVLKTSRAFMARGVRAVFGVTNPQEIEAIKARAAALRASGKTREAEKMEARIAPEVNPKDFSDGVQAFRAGAAGVTKVAEVLSGGEPLLNPAGSDMKRTFRWNEPAKVQKSMGK